MSQLRLYNSLTNRKEDFSPIDDSNVRVYTCGPTVYNYAHIGNARPPLVSDILVKLLKYLYSNVLYVSNITDHPFNKDGTGYISKIGLDGTVIEQKWIDKLNAPKGLTISKDKLYIADVDELVEVDIATAKVTNKYKGYGSVCMNDVTHDKYGNVYVGDTYNDTIYRLNQFGQLPAWFYSPGLAPNGIHIDEEAVMGLTLSEAVDKMRGPINTELKITVIREGKEAFDLNLKRAIIKVTSIKAKKEEDVAYI